MLNARHSADQDIQLINILTPIITGVVLVVVLLGVWGFATWSRKDKERRRRDVNTSVELSKPKGL